MTDRSDHDADPGDHDADRRDHDADLRDHDGPIRAITMGRFPHWRLVHGTGGRPITIPLPDDLSESQVAYIKSHMPRGCRLVPPGERVADVSYERDMDGSLDTLRALTAQITEKKIELLKTENELSTVKLELEREKLILEERRKHARSFGGALSDLAETLGVKFKL